VLENGQANLNANFTEKKLGALPLAGRNFTSIAALVPGISTSPQANVHASGTFTAGSEFASAGTYFTAGGVTEGSRDNGYYVNGVNITDNYESSISYEPSVEALSTGSLQVADFGSANGHDFATLTMQTKGGTSTFHGEAYDFVENDDLNAVNPFTKAQAAYSNGTFVKPTLRRNQFGGGIGGPVFSKHLLPSWSNKGFFFANYERHIERDGAASVATSVPSLAERTGDFSELLPSVQLYNPFATTYNSSGQSTRPIIPGNRLDLATRSSGAPLLDPGATAVMNLFPKPTNSLPSTGANYFTTKTTAFSAYRLDTRFDANITARDNIFVTFSHSAGLFQNSGGYDGTPLLYVRSPSDTSSLITLNYAHTFSPRIVNEFIFGIGHGVLQSANSGQLSYLNSDANPLNTLFQNTGTGLSRGIFNIQTTNYLAPGFKEIYRDENTILQFSDNVDWTWGKHTFSIGGNSFNKGETDWDFSRYVQFKKNFSRSGYQQGYVGGDAMADLALGQASLIHQRYAYQGGSDTAPVLDVAVPYYGIYANDKIQFSPRLTLTVGLRYDLSIPIYGKNSLCCQVYQATSDGGVLKLPGTATGVPQHYLSAGKTNFAPRFSFAYNVDSRTVVRAGYAIFNDVGATQISAEVGNALTGEPGYFSGDEISNVTAGALSDTPVFTMSNVFQAQKVLQLGTFPVSTGTGAGYYGATAHTAVYYYDQASTVLPYYQRMMLDIQHQFTPNDNFTVSYVGSLGRHGSNYVNINQAPYHTGYATINAYNAARPNTAGRFGDIWVQRANLNASYHSLVVQYNRSASHGLQFLANYTLGKTLSDYPTLNTLANNSEGGVNGYQYSQVYNRGESTFSHRQRFVASAIWAPVYGEKWNPLLREIATGWQTSTIVTFESGDTFTAINTATSAQDYAGIDVLNLSGNPNLGHSKKTFLNQFNTAQFSIPANGARGNSGLGNIQGPGQENVDLSLSKSFPILETLHAEFRADGYNVLNHTQWTGVQNTRTSSGLSGGLPFGAATSARDGRILQLSAKLSF